MDSMEVRIMTYKILLVAILSVFLTSISYGTDNIYTWIDDQGVLYITDYVPPYGVEIIDVSPSRREAAKKIQGQRLLQQEKMLQAQERQEMRVEAALARRVEVEALKTAEESIQRAEELRQQVKGSLKKRRRYYRRAEQYEQKAEEALKKAEVAGRRAEILEKMLGGQCC